MDEVVGVSRNMWAKGIGCKVWTRSQCVLKMVALVGDKNTITLSVSIPKCQVTVHGYYSSVQEVMYVQNYECSLVSPSCQ